MGVRDSAVDVEFFVWYWYSRWADVVWAVKTISSGIHLGPMSFWLWEADVGDPGGVCNFSAFRDLRLVDENMVPVLLVLFAFRAGFSYTDEKKSTPFVTIGSGPIFCCWTFKNSFKGGLFSCFFLKRFDEGGDVIVIPFHANVLVNVVYLSSKTSAVAMENTFCPSGKIGVIGQFSYCWFLCRAFRVCWYEVMVLGLW